MATFPRTEPTVLALVQEMITGLTANAATFPNLPVPASGPPPVPNLTLMAASYTTARDAAMAALPPPNRPPRPRTRPWTR